MKYLALTAALLPAVLTAPNHEALDFVRVARSSSEAVCCGKTMLKSCAPAQVNTKALGAATLRLPEGSLMSFSNNIQSPNEYYYKGENGGDMVLVHNPATGGVHAHAVTADGRSFVLENCVEDGHVWKEQDTTQFREEMSVPDTRATSAAQINHNYDALVEKAKNSKASASYSVKIYYTQDMLMATPDFDGFSDLAVAETNQGYANSNIDVSVYKLCTEQATIGETYNAGDMYNNFYYMKGSTSALRGNADAANLMITEFEACGIGALDATRSGNTVTVTMKSCAVGYYSFGHEIGHNFGCQHDPDTSTNYDYPYGHGHLIEKGYRTVLAYNSPGYSTRVNYYSNPAINYPGTGTSTGVTGLSNNARVITENRYAMDALGSDSGC